LTAKSGRAELEPSRERIDELCYRWAVAGFSCGQEIVHLLPGLWIRVLGGPAGDCGPEVAEARRRA
jgi:hypothetical protein